MPDTYFPQTGSGSTLAQPSDFTKDAFSDYTFPATSNTSLTSTVSTNPKNDFFANTDAPRFGAKTLRIKDLVLEDDTSKWVNGAKTWRIVFYDQDPNFKAYAYGNVSLIKLSDTKAGIVINSNASGVGISGVVRKAGFILNLSMQTASARTYVDGTFASSIDYSGQGLNSDGTNQNLEYSSYEPFKYHVVDTGSMQTNDIHNYEIRGDVIGTSSSTLNVPSVSALTVFGIIAYVENGSVSVECPPGTSYVDKVKVASTFGMTLALPALNASLFHLGAKTSFFKTAAGAFGASTLQVPLLQTQATGLSGTNLVTTSAGQGQSFPIGTGLDIQAGSSHYVGIVTNQSSDTLTLSPTLSFGIAGATLTKAFYTSATVTISATTYAKAWTWNPARSFALEQGSQTGATGFQGAANATLTRWAAPYVEYEKLFMVEPICNNVTTSQIPFVNSVEGMMGWCGPFRIAGDAQALEVEMFIGISGIVSGTFTIDGFNAYGVSLARGSTTGQTTAIFKLPIATDMGLGFHTLKFESNVGSTKFLITGVNGYKTRGPTSAPGVAAYLEQTQSFVDYGTTVDKNFWGTRDIIPASQMYLKGGWAAAVATSQDPALFSAFKGYFVAQGFSSANFIDPNSVMRTEFFGNRFCIHGTLFSGGSYLVALNGASFGAPFNTVVSAGATDAFNVVTLTRQTGTLAISALSYGRTYNDMQNVQNFNAIPSLLELPGSQIKENTVSVRKASKRFFGSSVGIGGFAISDSISIGPTFFPGVFTTLAGLKVSIATSGNPVAVGLMATSVFNPASPSVANSAIQVNRGGAGSGTDINVHFIVQRYLQSTGFQASGFASPGIPPVNPGGVASVADFQAVFNGTQTVPSISVPPSSLYNPADIVPAGNYFYQFGMITSSITTTIQFFNIRLYAYEIF